MNSLFFYGNIVQQYSYLLRPPPPRLAPVDRDGLDDRDGLVDLDEEDLLDELGDADLLDELGDADLLLDVVGLVDALLDDEAPLLVLPDCDVAGFDDALLDPEAPDPRPACDVEGRVPPLPAVLKFPLLTLLLTRLEVFLLFLL